MSLPSSPPMQRLGPAAGRGGARRGGHPAGRPLQGPRPFQTEGKEGETLGRASTGGPGSAAFGPEMGPCLRSIARRSVTRVPLGITPGGGSPGR